MFNVGDDPAYGEPNPCAVDYRRRRNRSLSVGDVARVDHSHAGAHWFAVCALGWERIAPPVVDNRTVHGTTAYEA